MKSFVAIFVSVLAGSFIYAQTAIPTFPKLKDGDPLPAGLFVNLAKAVNPAVVNIYTTYGTQDSRMFADPYRDPFYDLFEQFMGPGRGQPQQSLGTGFIIREDGLIVTNNHVVDRADVIKVQLEEGAKENYEARLIGKDARSDIALIKIDAKRKLPYLKMGSSSEVQVGEWVAAFGNPYGYGHTMTKGIISAVNREIDELNLFPFMQTDASINPGNSGGPLVNTQGLVIGVNAAIDARAQGIGFVIPIDNVKAILPELEKSGTIQRGVIGIQMTDIDPENAAASGLKHTEGALIIQVAQGYAADKAGLQAWDLIVEFDGKKVSSTRDVAKFAATTPVGKKVPMKVIRNGKEKSLILTMGGSLDQMPAKKAGKEGSKGFEGLQKAPYNLGFAVVDYSPQLRDEYGLPNLRQPHPVIISVQPNSESARAGLAAGDIIMDVNRREVAKAKDAVRHLKRGTINILRVLKRDRMVLISIRAK